MPEALCDYLEFATETAYLAGRLTLGHFQTRLQPDLKPDRSLVTIADREAEQVVRRRIEKRYASHAIIGEEYGAHGADGADHRWFIDPIDGTLAFVHGVPSYAVLIGLEIEGTVQVGVAYFPALDEMVAAATGHGCWWNGRRARVSKVPHLDEALVAFTDVASFSEHGRSGEWERIKQATRSRAGWGDAYGHCLVATGRAELMLDPIMSPWDCAPFPPILREAGGFFGDWQGTRTIYGQEAMSTTGILLPEVLALMQGALTADDK
jgi:myo-inositol-1(or 4)-monophosphatase